MYFNVRSHPVGGWIVVTVVGELDLASVPVFRAEIHRQLAGAARLILDLRACDLIDSSGLGGIVGTARRANDAGVPFVLVVGERSRDSLTRARLDEILELHDDLAIAETGGSD